MNFITLSFFLILVHLIIHQSRGLSQHSSQPVIGILTIPSDSSDEYPPNEYSYIPGSYVKHYWGAGARIVPIQWDLSHSDLKYLFQRINGLIITGGAHTFSIHNLPFSFGVSAKYLVDLAIEANKNGDYFPVYGTCLGYQLLAAIMAKNWSMNVHVPNGNNIIKNVYLTEAGKHNKIYQNMPKYLIYQMEHNRISFFHHIHTPDPQAWVKNSNLRDTMQVLSWTPDNEGSGYAALVGGIDLPFWGSQFHPEKISFEWWEEQYIPHQGIAILYQQYFASFFVNETKMSNHAFDSEKELQSFDLLKMNPIHQEGPFEQIYYFRNLRYSNGTEFQDDKEGLLFSL